MERWGCTLVAALRLLLAVAPLVARHKLQAKGLQELRNVGSVAAVRGGLVASQYAGSSWIGD